MFPHLMSSVDNIMVSMSVSTFNAILFQELKKERVSDRVDNYSLTIQLQGQLAGTPCWRIRPVHGCSSVFYLRCLLISILIC